MKLKMTNVLDKKTGQSKESHRVNREMEVIRLMTGRGLLASYVQEPTRAFHSSQVITFTIIENKLIMVTLNTIYEFEILEGLKKWLNRQA